MLSGHDFVDDEGTKRMKQMILYSRNVKIIYPEIDADLVDGSKLNIGINSGMCRCSYIVQVSIVRRHGIILGSTVFVHAINERNIHLKNNIKYVQSLQQ